MTFEQFKEIALHAAKGTAPANFTAENVNAAFVDGLKELAGTVNKFMKNRYDIYEVIIEAVDEVLPKRIAALNNLAEVQIVGEGQKAIFRRRVGRIRAKKFLTQVAISGVYETFRLDTESFEIPVTAVGGGATIDFQRMLDGVETLADIMDIFAEGLSDAAYLEVAKALAAAYASSNMPAANKAISNGFSADNMVGVMNVVRSYGEGVTIFATSAFIQAMGPDAVVSTLMNSTTPVAQGIYVPADVDDIHRTGLVRLFRGAPVVEIPNAYTDETNAKVWIDDQYAFVLPSGREKVVKLVLEGPTQIKDHENKDNSLEIYAWKKMGVGILTYYNWGVYQNTALAGHN